jgi:hypothetical protein
VKDVLRGANILICFAAILYFLMAFVFAPLLNARVPLIDRAWVYVMTTLIVVPQVFLLLLFLLFEIRKAGSIRRHAIVLLLIMATIGVGYAYTLGVTSPMQISPDTKRATLRPPVSISFALAEVIRSRSGAAADNR